jgi:hypothetical protein
VLQGIDEKASKTRLCWCFRPATYQGEYPR